jgi:hypothetical protein
LGVSSGILLYSTGVNAAEQVFLKYGGFRGAVSVQQLNQFVKTGKTTPALEAYLKTAKQDPAVARKALTARLKAEPAFLNNLLSSWAGPILLDQVGSSRSSSRSTTRPTGVAYCFGGDDRANW